MVQDPVPKQYATAGPDYLRRQVSLEQRIEPLFRMALRASDFELRQCYSGQQELRETVIEVVSQPSFPAKSDTGF